MTAEPSADPVGPSTALRGRPPGPDLGPIAAGRAFLHDPIQLLKDAASHGDVAYFRAGPYRVFVASHPDLVREVLVTRNRLPQGPGVAGDQATPGRGAADQRGPVSSPPAPDDPADLPP
jgi:hypothetical protein